MFSASSQFSFGIAAISEEIPQQRVFFADGFEHSGRTLTVLNIDGMNNKPNEVPEHNGDDIPFAVFAPLHRIEAARPTRLVVFNDWLSITSAVDDAGRPTCFRTIVARSWLMLARMPS